MEGSAFPSLHLKPEPCNPSKEILTIERESTLGRNSINSYVDVDLKLKEAKISRIHAKIFFENGNWFISDQNSKHGTKVDGVTISNPTVLSSGCQVSFGVSGVCVYRVHIQEPQGIPRVPVSACESQELDRAILRIHVGRPDGEVHVDINNFVSQWSGNVFDLEDIDEEWPQFPSEDDVEKFEQIFFPKLIAEIVEESRNDIPRQSIVECLQSAGRLMENDWRTWKIMKKLNHSFLTNPYNTMMASCQIGEDDWAWCTPFDEAPGLSFIKVKFQDLKNLAWQSKRDRFEIAIVVTGRPIGSGARCLAMIITLNNEFDIRAVNEQKRRAEEEGREDEADSRPLELRFTATNEAGLKLTASIQKFKKLLVSASVDWTWLSSEIKSAFEDIGVQLGHISKVKLVKVNDADIDIAMQSSQRIEFCNSSDTIGEAFRRVFEQVLPAEDRILWFIVESDEVKQTEELKIQSKSLSMPHPEQMHVAKRVLERVEYVLNQKNRPLTSFEKMSFIVLVPNFATLRLQTRKRVAKHVDPNVSENRVIPFSKSSNESFQVFKAQALDSHNRKTLFVIVADESHWGPRPNSAHDLFVNDDSLLKQDNVVVLQVSATPYCNLTSDSRIPERYIQIENSDEPSIKTVLEKKLSKSDEELHIIEWNADQLARPGNKSTYVSLEHYLMTIPSFLRHDVAGSLERPFHDKVASSKSTIERPLALQRLRKDESFVILMKRIGVKLPDENQVSQTTGGTRQIGAKRDDALDVLLTDYAWSLTYFAHFRWRDSAFCITEWQDPKERWEFWDHPSFVDRVKSCLSQFRELCKTDFLDSVGASCGKSLEKVANSMISEMLSEAKKEISRLPQFNPAAMSDEQIMAYIVWEKLTAENPETLQSSPDQNSWLTETDLIILDLLKANASLYDSQKGGGHMKIVRVFNCEGGSWFCDVIRTFRDALFPTDSTFEYPPFAVIPDFGNTGLKSQIEARFKIFLSSTISSRLTEEEVKDISEDEGDKLQYASLKGLPCILVLCEKGRMGDTFPKSFDCLDLRLRTSDNITTLVQELGRLCRYSDIKSKAVSFPGKSDTSQDDDIIKLFTKNNMLAISDDAGRFVGYATQFGTWEAASNVTVLASGTLEKDVGMDIEIKVNAKWFRSTIICRADIICHCRLAMINYNYKGTKCGACRSILDCRVEGDNFYLQLNSAFSRELHSARSFAVLQDGSSFQFLRERYCADGGHIHELEYQLPYALIRSEVMQKLERAVDDAERYGREIWECVQLKTLDQYMRRSGKGKQLRIDSNVNELHDYRNCWKAVGGENGNFDSVERLMQKHDLRFLLFAECQIGKTGAYCGFLRLLAEKLQLENEHAPRQQICQIFLLPNADQPFSDYSFPSTDENMGFRTVEQDPFWSGLLKNVWDVLPGAVVVGFSFLPGAQGIRIVDNTQHHQIKERIYLYVMHKLDVGRGFSCMIRRPELSEMEADLSKMEADVNNEVLNLWLQSSNINTVYSFPEEQYKDCATSVDLHLESISVCSSWDVLSPDESGVLTLVSNGLNSKETDLNTLSELKKWLGKLSSNSKLKAIHVILASRLLPGQEERPDPFVLDFFDFAIVKRNLPFLQLLSSQKPADDFCCDSVGNSIIIASWTKGEESADLLSEISTDSPAKKRKVGA